LSLAATMLFSFLVHRHSLIGPSNDKERISAERKSEGRAVVVESKDTCGRRFGVHRRHAAKPRAGQMSYCRGLIVLCVDTLCAGGVSLPIRFCRRADVRRGCEIGASSVTIDLTSAQSSLGARRLVRAAQTSPCDQRDNRTPGWSPSINWTPATSRARLMAAKLLIEGSRRPFSKSRIVLSLKLDRAANSAWDQSSSPRAARD